MRQARGSYRWAGLALLIVLVAMGCRAMPGPAGTATLAAPTRVVATATEPGVPTEGVAPTETLPPPPTATEAAGATEAPTATEAAGATEAPTPTESRPSDGLPLPAVFSAHFAGSGTCVLCHDGLADRSGEDVSIGTHWRSTMMANGAKDPLWQAVVSAEVARNPGLAETIESKCATCHTPMAYTEAGAMGGSVVLAQDGFLDPDHALHEVAMDGVSCTLCHQIEDLGLGDQSSYSGAYSIDTTTSPPDRLIYGPFPDPMQHQMQMHTGYTPVEGAHVRDAALCATCHTLYTPYVDADGNVAGTFPEQVVYLEWAHSSYGDSVPCQGCHMPAARGRVAISSLPRMLEPREPFSQHYFVGGNAFMSQLLGDHIPELSLTASRAEFDATRARTMSQLENRTARIEIVTSGVVDGRLEVVLSLSNMAGHKFPTGFPSRRAWIHLTVTDAGGEVVFESGRPGADGSIAGAAADGDLAAFEPHYDRIVDPDQVQIYESVMQDSDGAVTYTLLKGASYVKDNRLLPAGFDPATALPDVAPAGAATADANFGGGSDQVTYDLDVMGHEGPYLVSAELLYHAVSYPFAADRWADETPSTERMRGYYESADHTPVVVWRAEGQVR